MHVDLKQVLTFQAGCGHAGLTEYQSAGSLPCRVCTMGSLIHERISLASSSDTDMLLGFFITMWTWAPPGCCKILEVFPGGNIERRSGTCGLFPPPPLHAQQVRSLAEGMSYSRDSRDGQITEPVSGEGRVRESARVSLTLRWHDGVRWGPAGNYGLDRQPEGPEGSGSYLYRDAGRQ